MSSTKEHGKKAEHNQDFVDHFYNSVTPYLDWVIIIHFYICVHLVEAYLGGEDIHSKNNDERFDNVRKNISKIRKQFSHLYGACRRARYDIFIPDFDYVDKLLSLNFEPIKNYILPKI